MAKRFIDTDLFKKRFVRGLKGAYKLLWVYLFCECDNAGIWEVDLEAAELFCGQKYNFEDLKKAFEGKIYFFNDDAKAFIPDFIEFQYGEGLNEKNPAHKSVILKLSKYQLLEILETRGLEGATKPQSSTLLGTMDMYKDMDKEKEKEKGGTGEKTKVFRKPTLEEVTAYCKERGNTIDPQQWIDHYTANGWKVGKNPMRDWKAAVRTWERNGITNEINNGSNGQKRTATATDRPTTVSGSPAKKTYTGTL